MKKLTSLCLVLLIIFTVVGCSSDSYKLQIADRADLLYEQPSKKYRVGEQVVIKTHIFTDVDIECFVNDESICRQTAVRTGDKYTHWEYYFEMPTEDVTISFEFVGGKG